MITICPGTYQLCDFRGPPFGLFVIKSTDGPYTLKNGLRDRRKSKDLQCDNLQISVTF